MSGNAVILQEDIDNFILTEVKPRIDGFKVIETRGIYGKDKMKIPLILLLSRAMNFPKR